MKLGRILRWVAIRMSGPGQTHPDSQPYLRVPPVEVVHHNRGNEGFAQASRKTDQSVLKQTRLHNIVLVRSEINVTIIQQ